MKMFLILTMVILSLQSFAAGTGNTGSAGESHSIEEINNRMQQLMAEIKNTTDIKKIEALTSEAIALSQELLQLMPPVNHQPIVDKTKVVTVTADKIFASPINKFIFGRYSKIRMTAIDNDVTFEDGFLLLGTGSDSPLHFNIYSLRKDETQEFDLAHDAYSEISHQWEKRDDMFVDRIRLQINSGNFKGSRGSLKIEFIQ
jgi:hypothetical protein